MTDVPEKKVKFVRTCYACPELYDAYIGEEKVGYLRLRHGTFTVECGGKCIHQTEALGDGMFEDEERDEHLKAAARVAYHWNRGGAPELVEYEVVEG